MSATTRRVSSSLSGTLATTGAAGRGRCDRTAVQGLDGVAKHRRLPAFRECWGGGSHCHGWSATPSRDLLVYTLGVSPAEPGYARVRVALRLGTLSGVRGEVPLPHGPVRVGATPDRVRVTSPVPAEVLHPDGSLAHHPSGSPAVALAGPAPRKD